MLVEEAWNSKYVAVFDALDGASNIDVGIVTGTIFSIYKENEECLVDYGENVSEEGKQLLLKTLIPKTNLVASGYCMYSSSTVMMFSMGDGVHGFTLDPSIGEFVLTHPNVRYVLDTNFLPFFDDVSMNLFTSFMVTFCFFLSDFLLFSTVSCLFGCSSYYLGNII